MFQIRTKFIVLFALGLAGLGAVAWIWREPAVDPEVQEIKELQAKLLDNRQEKLDPESTIKQIQELRKRTRSLDEEQQTELREEGMNLFRSMIQQRVTMYHELPQESRVAYLDQQIDEMEMFGAQMRKMGEQRQKERQAAEAEAAEQASESEPTNTDENEAEPAESKGTEQGSDRRRGEGGRGRRGDMSDEQRDNFRRRILDESTPQERAEFGAYFEALRDRRKERGLPEGRWGRR